MSCSTSSPHIHAEADLCGNVLFEVLLLDGGGCDGGERAAGILLLLNVVGVDIVATRHQRVRIPVKRYTFIS